jgi:hypothetical protein
MITVEMLAADAALAGLTDEQKNAIALMSKNDEEVVICNRFREVYNKLDDTIAKETGIARNGDEKTYLYLERAAKTLAAKANSVDWLNTKIADLTKERDKLKQQVAEGGDEATRKQLAQAQKDLDAVRTQYDTLKADFDKAKTDHAAELLGVQIDNVLAGAQAGLKFKPEFPQAATDTLLAQALMKIKGMNPDFIDDGKGGKRLVFKGENGEIARDPENHLEPYTAEALLKKELRAMGILDDGRKAAGAGTTPPAKTPPGGIGVYVSQARTQQEADNIIHNQLNAQGLVRGSKKYQEAYDAAWRDNNINTLPMK